MILGIHHVTAICSQPQRNLDFYSGVLGLRLVKKTVNFDDPSSYHLYYGDDAGSPGTIITFFAWPRGEAGEPGAGQATRVSFAIGPSATTFWRQRLEVAGVDWHAPATGGATTTRFADPDGLALELAEDERYGRPRATGGIGERDAIRGIRAVALTERDAAPSVACFTDLLGFRRVDAPGDAFGSDGSIGPQGSIGTDDDAFLSGGAFRPGNGGADAGVVEFEVDRAARPGRVAVGSVHHVAWRIADEESQKIFRNLVLEAGIGVSRVLDRVYFRSIYFREPGGVLLEVATDGPGFTADEPLESLGSALRLPPWLEAERDEIEPLLLPLDPQVPAP